jgi:hypothetical protein
LASGDRSIRRRTWRRSGCWSARLGHHRL